ncbi:COG4280 domain-containing protein [Microbacterium sp. CJ88]|uniref:COG4280 domain-containing protein n=1 Tax=Microbacterium sp. CJ88 TaxID=3445672 RepID=UPI003F65BFCF
MTPAVSLFIAVFLACLVEAVEATTVVLAAGTARNWRSALQGMGVGILALAVIIALLGPTLQLIPIESLRLVVGGLLLVFGLQWLRKAVLRASGFKALHDEDAAFASEVEAAQAAGAATGRTDWYAFTLSFKATFLEGLEVAFIALTFGTVQHQVGVAALAAVVAVVVVALLGVVVRKPLARVPENTLKFAVGVMLTSFGIFWGAEGAGATWPGADLSLLGIIPGILIVALVMVAILKGVRRRRDARVVSIPAPTVHVGAAGGGPLVAEPTDVGTAVDAEIAASPAPRPSFGTRLARFGMFWYDFVIGDDWRVAAGIVVAFVVTLLLAATSIATWWIVPLAVVLVFCLSLSRSVRRAA